MTVLLEYINLMLGIVILQAWVYSITQYIMLAFCSMLSGTYCTVICSKLYLHNRLVPIWRFITLRLVSNFYLLLYKYSTNLYENFMSIAWRHFKLQLIEVTTDWSQNFACVWKPILDKSGHTYNTVYSALQCAV